MLLKTLNITLIITILWSFFAIPLTFASTLYYITEKTTFKTEPNELGTYIVWTHLDPGDAITLVEGVAPVDSTNPICATKYYYVKYSSVQNWVCGDDIRFESAGIYDAEFLAAGFPASYLPSLNILKDIYPNWTFTAINTNLEWNDVLDAESNVGKSLIQSTNQGWRSTDGLSYDYLTDTFFPFEGSSWFAANRGIVGYYLDPRNFLNAYDILMFESMDYRDTQSIEVVRKILANTFMNGTFVDTDGLTYDYAEVIMTAALENGISPYLIATRIKQEVAIGTTGFSSSVSGTVEGYLNLFNYFNIGAHPTEDEPNSIINGLKYASGKGWTSRVLSIKGGATFLKNNYIARGQNTLYFQKWDVIGPEYYGNQYMTNIMAPKTESNNVYNAYSTLGILSLPITVAIPVYNNMPLIPAQTPNIGNPNNYLSALNVDGKLIEGFDPTKTDYTIHLEQGFPTIGITATKINSNATVVGTGSITFTQKTTNISIDVTAQNGEVKKYNLTVIKPDDIPIDPIEVINHTTYKTDGVYVSGIPMGTNVDTIQKIVFDINSLASVVVKDSNGLVVTNRNYGTGDKIVVTSNGATVEYPVIIYGDVNGDGLIDIVDLLRTQKVILGSITLSEVYLKASDNNKSGVTDIADLLKVQKKILGVSDIEQ